MKHPFEPGHMRGAMERAYPLPEGYMQRTRQTLRALTQKKEQPNMKKRMTLSLAAAMLLFGITGALAITQWGVLDFLFQGTQRDDLRAFTHPLALTQTVDDVRLTVDSAFYDGETFAMDWTVENTRPDRPVFLQVDEYTVGGHRLHTDGNDSFDGQWLPGVFAPDATMQDGERVSLPVAMLTGDTQPVMMRVGLYRPTKPLYQLPSDDDAPDMDEAAQTARRQQHAALALEKMREGHLVVWDDTFAIKDEGAEGGVAFVLGDLKRIWPEDAYTLTYLDMTFDLDVRDARAAIKPLSPKEQYAFDVMTTRYTKAVRTPSGVALTLEAKPLPGQEAAFESLMAAGSWQATDGAGTPIDKWPDEFYSAGLPFDDGAFGRKVLLVLSLTADELPGEVSLSFVPEDGAPALVSPVDTL